MTHIAMCHNTTKYLLLHYRQLISGFVESGLRVTCISPADSYVRQLEELGVEHISIDINQHGINPYYDIKYISRYMMPNTIFSHNHYS